jgi:hypothetical protein
MTSRSPPAIASARRALGSRGVSVSPGRSPSVSTASCATPASATTRSCAATPASPRSTTASAWSASTTA